MRSFRVVSDRAKKGEVSLEINGQDLDQLFANSAKAVEQTLVAPQEIKKAQIRNVNLQAKNIPELLFQFLSDIVFLKETYQLLFSQYEISVNQKAVSLAGKLKGEQFDPKRHRLRMAVIGIKKGGFVLKKVGDFWRAEMTLETAAPKNG